MDKSLTAGPNDVKEFKVESERKLIERLLLETLFVMQRLSASSLRNHKGQVAIFIALIFQVLFLFFAMIINVGLLVHHKINLQNSTDLAAYYGAMKQAETLNAIGHVNYQIRQSWKLLTWRYRMIGTGGDIGQHPYLKIGIGGAKARTIQMNPAIQPNDAEGYPQKGLSKPQQAFYDAPPFCAVYSPFQPSPQGGNGSQETLCKDQSTVASTLLFTAPKIIGFGGLQNVINSTFNTAITAAVDRCKFAGVYNYMMLSEFLTGYNMDQGERKQLINLLSRGLSDSTSDFRELNGDMASLGIKETFSRNLTEANRASANFQIINGLGIGKCNSASAPSTFDPAPWLSEIKIYPALAYMDFNCPNSQLQPNPRELTANPPTYLTDSTIPKDVQNKISSLLQYVGSLNPPYNSSLGFEKNPWCVAYVGVVATASPKIPFAPLTGIQLQARSFAKPFGGRIGPWYGSMWSPASEQSTGSQTDPLVPKRTNDVSQIADPNDVTRIPNYSRFVGDMYGLKSRTPMGQWAKAIYNLNPDWSRGAGNPNAGPSMANDPIDSEPNFLFWSHLGVPFNQNTSGDILAWNTIHNQYPHMRDLELAAILPDQFDITYYSIDPDYYHNYYQKIAQYVKKVPGFSYIVRPDLGSRLGDKTLEPFSVREQYNALQKVQTSDIQSPTPQVEFNTKLQYVALKAEQVLTSWISIDQENYSLDSSRFGKCLSPRDPNGPPTFGDCVNGGRAGYSVKVISSSYLTSSNLTLGGDNAGSGPIWNPPSL